MSLLSFVSEAVTRSSTTSDSPAAAWNSSSLCVVDVFGGPLVLRYKWSVVVVLLLRVRTGIIQYIGHWQMLI